jgi:hypothetical protein
LTEAVQASVDTDLQALSRPQLMGHLESVDHAIRRLEAERLETIASSEKRRTFERDGLLDSTQQVAAVLNVRPGTARALVGKARLLEKMPAIADAYRRGDLNSGHVAVAARTAELAPDQYGEYEADLLKMALEMEPAAYNRAATYLHNQIEGLRNRHAHQQRLRRRLRFRTRLDGMVHLEGELDPDTAEPVIAAISALVDTDSRGEGWKGDFRSPDQKRADALADLAHHYLDRTDRPDVAGEKPHVTVLVDLPTLQGKPGRLSEYGSGTVITPEAAETWACDASITRILVDPDGLPLDVGRATRTVPSAIRKALILRDGHCQHPGCNRPQQWCDAHHIIHWARGGPTSLQNLILLCRPHHRLAHDAQLNQSRTGTWDP